MSADIPSLVAWLMMLVQAYRPDMTEAEYAHAEQLVADLFDVLFALMDVLTGDELLGMVDNPPALSANSPDMIVRACLLLRRLLTFYLR